MSTSNPVASSSSIAPQQKPSSVTATNQNILSADQDPNRKPVLGGNGPVILNLTEAEKNLVKDRVRQVMPFYSKIDMLIRTLIQCGGQQEMDKLSRLKNLVSLGITSDDI
jgi:hypothetical protein